MQQPNRTRSTVTIFTILAVMFTIATSKFVASLGTGDPDFGWLAADMAIIITALGIVIRRDY